VVATFLENPPLISYMNISPIYAMSIFVRFHITPTACLLDEAARLGTKWDKTYLI
jgi:hypothetical protein